MDNLVQQLVKLGDDVTQLTLDNATLKAQIEQLKKDGGGQGGGRGGGQKSALRDLKKLYPNTFNPGKDVFATWADDFIRAESEPLATALEAAAQSEEEVPMQGGEHREDVRFAWLPLKKLMGDKESVDIVRITASDNSLESFRLLHRRYSPKTSAVRSRKLRLITNFAEKHANSKISAVAQLISTFEEMNRKYHEEYKVHPLTQEMVVDTLKSIIPAEVEKAINLSMVGRAAPGYGRLKELILDYVGDTMPVPMEVGAVAEARPATTEEPEDVNSLGQPKGLGKGKGGAWATGGWGTGKAAAGAGFGKGARMPDGACRI